MTGMTRLILKSFAMALALAVTMTPAAAATPNYSVAVPGVQVIPLHLGGQYTGDEAGVARFQIPFEARVIGVSVSARASGGTSPTLDVDILDDGTSILSAAVSVTAGSMAEGTVANPVVDDESVVTVDFTITGTSPTWDDVTILITVVRQ